MTEEKAYISNLLEVNSTNPEKFNQMIEISGETLEDLKFRLQKAETYINKAQGVEPEKKKPDFSLINVKDELLSEEDKKLKKKQLFLKAMADSREDKQKEKETKKAKMESEENKLREKNSK